MKRPSPGSRPIDAIPRLLIAATFLLTLIPTGQAQGSSQVPTDRTLVLQAATEATKEAPVTLLNPAALNEGRLPPETAQLQIQFAFEVVVPAQAACPSGTVLVSFTKRAVPEYAVGVLSSSAAVLDVSKDTPGSVYTGSKVLGPAKTVLTVGVDRHAPAFNSFEFGVDAVAVPAADTASGCNLKKSDTTTLTTSVRFDYIPLMQYQPAKYILKAGQNKDISFAVLMTNFGNGPTKITTEATAVGKSRLDAVIPPAQLTLESKALSPTATNVDTALISVRTPFHTGYTNSLYSVQARFTATGVQAATESGTIGRDVQTISLSIQVQGVYVPGFDPASAVGSVGLALAVLGLARRRP